MSWSRVFSQTLLILGIGVALVVAGLVTGIEPLGVLGWLAVAASFLRLAAGVLRAVTQRLLWRVSRRLLVSYVLLGLLPVVLVVVLAGTVSWVLSGQLAVRRVDGAVTSAMGTLAATASTVDAELARAPTPAERLEVLRAFDSELPGTGLAYLPAMEGEAGGDLAGRDGGDGSAVGVGPFEPALLLPRGRIYTHLQALGTLADGRHFLAHLRPAEHGVVLAYFPVEPDLRTWLHRRTGAAVAFPEEQVPPGEELDSIGLSSSEGLTVRTRIPSRGSEEGGAAEIGAEEHGGSGSLESEGTFRDRPVATGQGGWADAPLVFWLRSLELIYVDWQSDDWHAAIEGEERPFPFLVWTSLAREYVELFGTHTADDTNLDFARVARHLVQGVGVIALVLYGLGSALAGFLVFRIARATRRLHDGFEEVESGRFDHRAEMGGQDQLAALVRSFNRMVEHLERATAERAERQAVDHELRLARELQQGLLPSPSLTFPGFEMAVDFAPAAAVGGDFYHLKGHSDGRLTVAIADVSGHGLATGIVMSAARSVLSVLADAGMAGSTLLSRLDHQFRDFTGPRTFVTLALALLDPPRGRAEVTTAGHLPPYRVSPDGSVTAVGRPARPLGIGLDAQFETVEAMTAPGDLWVFLSDGIIEATSEDGELFGFERFEDLLGRCAGLSAEAARDLLIEAWRRFATHDTPEDDRTLLVLRVTADRAADDG